MMYKPQITVLTIAFGLALLIIACDPPPQEKKKSPPPKIVSGTISPPKIVSGKISQPAIQKKPQKNVQKDDINKEKNDIALGHQPSIKDGQPAVAQPSDKQKNEPYDAQGKTDPFRPLIQEKTEEVKAVVDERPKRILTPLEKIDLSQIRLVAVIIMKNKQIAMVEEASGKGYEIGIGTYIGRNQGRVAEIKDSSIIIKELVRDYKGRLNEHVQEIKLHKNDNEG